MIILLMHYSYEQNDLRQNNTTINETPGQVCIVISVSCHHIVLLLCDIKKI